MNKCAPLIAVIAAAAQSLLVSSGKAQPVSIDPLIPYGTVDRCMDHMNTDTPHEAFEDTISCQAYVLGEVCGIADVFKPRLELFLSPDENSLDFHRENASEIITKTDKQGNIKTIAEILSITGAGATAVVNKKIYAELSQVPNLSDYDRSIIEGWIDYAAHHPCNLRISSKPTSAYTLALS